MKTMHSVDWDLLLDSNSNIRSTVTKWANGNISSRAVSEMVMGTQFSSAFRHLLRTHGTMYGRRLARKAINYRQGV